MKTHARILFVDDEPHVLSALKRMLRRKSDVWDMHFVENGTDALHLLERHPIDIIISDIRMPGMDGAELLTRIKELSPGTIRIALSGQVDMNEVVRSIKAVHQYISKPCEAGYLIDRIESALRSQAILTNNKMIQLVTRIEALPVIPEVFEEAEAELRKDEPSIEVIATTIARDVGLVAEIIKLINSPYFGLPTQVDSVEKAITLLGLDTIRALIFSTHLFTVYEEKTLPTFSLSLLWEHSFRVSNIARLIATHEAASRHVITQCRMAGLLHDVGKLVMASAFSKKYTEALDQVASHPETTISQAEQDLFEITHAEVGAYLMGLWGMSSDVVHAIGYHHRFNEIDNDVARYLSLADSIDHHFVILHDQYSRTSLREKLLSSKVNQEEFTQWISYINENWSGESPLNAIPTATITELFTEEKHHAPSNSPGR
ncbi:response regulator [Pseudodesulfovibrio sp. JC047]|uniref:response regulator n=1 Tax=Pseudodesulfovibrio sp. JC047 TaxID=2683199 RepID=UPI0013D2B270|nr:response regulator [Pseudodesulfovibrio sp. JC047]